MTNRGGGNDPIIELEDAFKPSYTSRLKLGYYDAQKVALHQNLLQIQQSVQGHRPLIRFAPLVNSFYEWYNHPMQID